MTTMRKKILLSVLIFSVILPMLSCTSLTKKSGTDSREKIYTIQTGSFLDTATAQKQFDFITHKMNRQERAYLRIEKVDKFYVVRLGKFKSYTKAKELLHSVKTHIPEAMITSIYK